MTLEQILELVKVIGVPGVVAVVAVYALRILHTQLTTVQEKRIDDARAATAQLLALVESENKQRELLIRALDNVADAVREQRMQLESMWSEHGIQPRPRMPLPSTKSSR